MQEVSKRKLNKPRMWDVSHAFPPAVLTASGLKGIISAEWHPQAKLITVHHPIVVALWRKYKQIFCHYPSQAEITPFPRAGSYISPSRAEKDTLFPRRRR